MGNYNYPFYNPAPAYQPPQQNGIIWVQGIQGAKGYMVAPGQTALLMDSEGSTFYMKSADQSGMPSLRIFDFQERTQAAPQAQPSGYEDLVRRVTALEAALQKGCAADE